jgi:hypothetical protein
MLTCRIVVYTPVRSKIDKSLLGLLKWRVVYCFGFGMSAYGNLNGGLPAGDRSRARTDL